MIPENSRGTCAFTCPKCLTTFHLSAREIGKGVPKCDYCGIPLERVRNRR